MGSNPKPPFCFSSNRFDVACLALFLLLFDLDYNCHFETMMKNIQSIAASLILVVSFVSGSRGDDLRTEKHVLSKVIEIREYRSNQSAASKAPVVLLIPGGGWLHCKHESVEPFVPLFTQAGYVVFSTNYRVVPEYPRPATWKADDPRFATWPAQIDDVRAAVWWIRGNAEKLKLNPDHLVAIGFSAGGMLAAHLACEERKDESGKLSSKVQGAITVGGPWDLRDVLVAKRNNRKTDIYPDPNSLGITMTLFGGTPETLVDESCPSIEQAWEASPQRLIQKDIAPILLLHGSRDQLVPAFQAERAHTKIEQVAPGSSTLKLFPIGHEVSADFLPPVKYFLEKVKKNISSQK